jgi:YD repeat-containing protein
VLSTVTEDTVDGLLLETTPQGITTAYPLAPQGYPNSVSYIQDAVGNRPTFSYASGLLQTIQDPVSRFVSFSYTGSLLTGIEDWAGRRTTFAYNTTLATPKNLLTTVTGPTGCQTQYQYSQVTLGSGSDWFLTGIIDPNGFGTSYTYNSLPQVTTRAVAGVGTTSYSYFNNDVITQDALVSTPPV